MVFYGNFTFADNISVVVRVTSSYEVTIPGITTEITVTGSYNGVPSLNTEEEIGNVEWQYGGGYTTTGATINPSAAETTWSNSNTRVINVTGNDLGEYTLIFIMKVRIQIKNKNTGAFIRYVEASGQGSAKLKVTNGKFKIVLAFKDNFAGRSKTRMGVCEEATITVEAIDPVGGTAKIISTDRTGNIKVSGTTVTAGDISGSGTIKVVASVNDGAAAEETLGVNVVAPIGVRQEKITPIAIGPWIAPVPNPDKKLYVQGMCSVAMNTVSYLRPTDVSFYNTKVGEGTCVGIGTGSQVPYSGLVHPSWKDDVSNGDILLGCSVKGPNPGPPPYDFISDIQPVTVGVGTFTWNIPWEYSCNSGNNLSFTTVIHQSVFDGNRGVKLSKAGNSVQHTTP
ncbi:MAG: hypothetical protein LBE18_12300 [Planctomycetaceae bacterium]|nr:hypothetical protein [Planctomycetaceae bacterium]